MIPSRAAVRDFMSRPSIQNLVIAVIIFNAAVLGAETSQALRVQFGLLLMVLDTACLLFFVLEIALRIYGNGWRFFRDGWSIFDFVIVAIAIAPAGQGVSVLRALRVLRVLRVMTVAPRLRRVVEGLVSALPGMGSVFLLMTLIFYIGAVMATKLFGPAFPEWFGDLGVSAYTLFQIMTLESWSMGIVRPVMEVYPMAWAFFVPFILVTTFAVVNLLVGLIVNSMQDAHSEEETEATGSYRDEVLAKLDAIDARLKRLEDDR